MAIAQWLAEEIEQAYLPKIKSLKNNPSGRAELEQFVKQVRDDWLQRPGRGGKTLNEQKLMDGTRRALKDALGENHWSLDIFKFSTEEYYAINSEKQKAARDRQQQQVYLNNPDKIVAVAVGLLESPKWADVACALAVLTGRRLNEVLKTAQFTVKSKWVVTFSGALKRRNDPIVFDIPTLTTAKKVVDALEKLRSITPEGANENAVGVATNKHFSGLVPAPGEGETLYNHLWRSVYACIASFWYCPPSVDDLLFKAHIMGHFEALPPSEQANAGVLTGRLETFSSERHYRLYEIADELIAKHNGKRKGIKLGYAGIKPLEIFEQQEEKKTLPQGNKETSSLRIYKSSVPRWNAIFGALCQGAENQQQRTETLLEWIEGRMKQDEQRMEQEDRQSTPDETIAPIPIPNLNNSAEELADPLRSDIQALIGVMQQLVQSGAAIALPHPAAQPRRAIVRAEGASERSAAKAERGATPTRAKRTVAASEKRIHDCIDAIMAHNNQPDLAYEEKWAITLASLKKLGNSQERIKLVMEERAAEIQQHHHHHQIEVERHNLYHRGKRSIEQVIRV